MKFAQFIMTHKEEITDEWVKNAQDNILSANEIELDVIRDHLTLMLDGIAENMEKEQTDLQQEEKSKGNKEMEPGESTGAKQHGALRADIGFDIVEVSSEFRALRASVLRLWEKSSKEENWEADFHDVVRFNEAIDQEWMISVQRFHHTVDESKNWFLGILGHDLRNPLAAISGVNSILRLSENLSEKEQFLLRRSVSSVKRMTELIDNILELTKLRLGSGMTINKSSVDLSEQSEKIVQELQLSYPDADLILKAPGPVQGEWDVLRLDQLITNLITNALRHGRPGGPVIVSISAKGNDALFEVHNEGTPIPESIKNMIFTGMFKMNKEESTPNESYGLGLYIVNEIVEGHKGQIDIRSTEESGTTFKITLPRH